MGIFGKNKNREKEGSDRFGMVDVPYRTNSKQMSDEGVFPIVARSRKNRDREKKLLKMIIALSLAFVMVVFFSAVSSNFRVNKLRDELNSQYSASFKTRYQELAEETIRAYFSNGDPVTNLLPESSWNNNDEFAKSVPVNVEGLALIQSGKISDKSINISKLKKDDPENFKNPRAEIYEFSGFVEGRKYLFTVTFIIPDTMNTSKLPYLYSPPIMTPAGKLVSSNIDGVLEPDALLNGSEFRSYQMTQEGMKTLTSWASAFAQDDKESLKRIAGDNDATHYYNGLGGFLLAGDPEVNWSFEKIDGSNQVIAQVRFNLESSFSVSNTGNDPVERRVRGGSTDQGKIRSVQVMDILMTNYQQGTPDIIAWGPAGTWTNLNEKSNVNVRTAEEESRNSIEPKPTNTTDRSVNTNSPSSSIPKAPSLGSKKSSSTSSKSGSKTSSKKE